MTLSQTKSDAGPVCNLADRVKLHVLHGSRGADEAQSALLKEHIARINPRYHGIDRVRTFFADKEQYVASILEGRSIAAPVPPVPRTTNALASLSADQREWLRKYQLEAEQDFEKKRTAFLDQKAACEAEVSPLHDLLASLDARFSERSYGEFASATDHALFVAVCSAERHYAGGLIGEDIRHMQRAVQRERHLWLTPGHPLMRFAKVTKKLMAVVLYGQFLWQVKPEFIRSCRIGEVEDELNRCQMKWEADRERTRSVVQAGSSRDAAETMPLFPIEVARAVEQSRGVCVSCGATDDLTVDHIVPRAHGGSNHPSNERLLCRRCNSRRGSRLG